MFFAVSAVGFFCIGSIIQGVYQYLTLQGDLQNAGDRVEILRQKKEKLEMEKNALGRLDQVEKVAREQYNMVKPNEIPVFIVEEKENKSEDK